MTTDFDQIRARTATLIQQSYCAARTVFFKLWGHDPALCGHHPYCCLFHLFHLTGLIILGAFAKLRKATISLVMSVYLSVCPHGTNSAVNARILTKFDITVLFENLRRKFKFYENLTRIAGTLHYGQYTFSPYLAQFSLEWQILKKNVEEIKTRILCSVTFFERRTVYEIMWKNIVEPERPQFTMWLMRISR